MANTAATQALGQKSLVIRSRTRNKSTDDAACSSTLVRNGRPGQSVELAVQHVGEGSSADTTRQRASVMRRHEVPRSVKPRDDMRVLENEEIVVVAEKVVASRLDKDQADSSTRTAQTAHSPQTRARTSAGRENKIPSDVREPVRN